MGYALAVHGGAGKWRGDRHDPALRGVHRAALAGRDVLEKGGRALDAVVAAVVVLEDDPSFNAGTGAALNLDGEAEMDAGVMEGAGLRAGAVGCIRRVRNPVLVARKVMEATDHVLLVGEGALRFARAFGFEEYDPITEQKRRDWQARREAMSRSGDSFLPRLSSLLRDHPELGGNTVGAVALGQRGDLAAATSTGGLMMRLPGRVGDTPIPGAGNYATRHCAVSATGRGELMMRFGACKAVCDRVGQGRTANQAVADVLAAMVASVGSDAGMIAVDHFGNVAIQHVTPAMPHAYVREGEPLRTAITTTP